VTNGTLPYDNWAGALNYVEYAQAQIGKNTERLVLVYRSRVCSSYLNLAGSSTMILISSEEVTGNVALYMNLNL